MQPEGAPTPRRMSKTRRALVWMLVGASVAGAVWTGADDVWGTVFFLGNGALMAMLATTPEQGEPPKSARTVVSWLFGIVMLIGLFFWTTQWFS